MHSIPSPPGIVAADHVADRSVLDGRELVETFHAIRRETGLKTWDATQTKAFRAVFVRMLHEARDKAKLVAG